MRMNVLGRGFGLGFGLGFGRGFGRGVIVATALAAGVVTMPGCIIIADGSSGRSWDTVSQTKSEAYVHAPGTPVQIDTRNGRVQVRRGTVSDVQITSKWQMRNQERLDDAKLSVVRRADGALAISAEPPGGSWRSGEGCSIELTLPEGTPVVAETSNGAVDVAGMSGLARVRTSNGAITVSDHAGDVDVETSNGRVELAGVHGKVRAETSNGAVTVRADEASAGPMDVSTSNGSIALTVGPTFDGTVNARTSNGSISVPNSSDRIRTASISRSRAEVAIGAGGPTSTLRTSNGSITISVR